MGLQGTRRRSRSSLRRVRLIHDRRRIQRLRRPRPTRRRSLMSIHDATMKSAQSLLWALEGVKVKPPKVLQNLVDGFELLGDTIQTAAIDPGDAIVEAAANGKLN